MFSRLHKIFILSLCVFSLIMSCGKDKKKNNGDQSAKARFSGKVSATSVFNFMAVPKVLAEKTITHIMAVSPSSGNTKRYVGEVAENGEFSLAIQSGKPYIIVFVSQADNLKGKEMIVGTVKVAAHDLDAFAVTEDEDVDLGEVTIEPTTSLGTISTSVSSLLSSLGISAAEAEYIGSVDDLALRLANPDIDSNGVIDANEGKSFGLDWHIRADTKLSGVNMVMDDIENNFADAANVSLTWTLGSAYAVYSTTFDNVTYVANSGVDNSFQNGGNFAVAGTALTSTSMSTGQFSNMRYWGPDYNMQTQELGASDATSTFVYTLGSSAKQLTYSNVRTKTKAELDAEGVLLPFIKLNTSGGKFTGVGYKWMKRQGSAWVAATSNEVQLLVSDDTAHLSLYTEKSPGIEKGVNMKIPVNQATGTINLDSEDLSIEGVADPANLTLDSFCSSALSYDDNIGLRIFAGSPAANSGVTPCP